MTTRMLKAKLHRVRVTEADLNYVGSLTVDAELLLAAGIRPFEMVQITSLSNGILWRTYVLAAPRLSGTVKLNGSAARWFHPGDEIIILAEGEYTEEEIASLRPRIILVDGENHITEVREERPSLPA